MAKNTTKMRYTAAELFPLFFEFCRQAKAVGGISPHLQMVGASVAALPLDQQLWRGGCYAATYNFAGAELLWRNWQPEAVRRQPQRFAEWVARHWRHIPLRKERKAVNAPTRFAENVMSFAEWLPWWETYPFVAGDWRGDNRARYQAAWDTFCNVKFMGRYIAIRFVEFMRRHIGGLDALVMPDIRPADAVYPRQTLALFFPFDAKALNGNNGATNLAVTNRRAAELRRRAQQAGVDLSYYELQVMLCEFKQSAKSRRQYAGRPLDTELPYFDRAYAPDSPFAAQAADSEFYQLRRQLFPAECLGELHGWRTARKDLDPLLADHGIVWSDLLFDYRASQNNLTAPVRRAPTRI